MTTPRAYAPPTAAARVAFVLLSVATATLLAACVSRPVSMPMVLPRSCAQAECGAGSCDDANGTRDAVCSCTPDQFRIRPYQCVTPITYSATPGRCTAPEECPKGQGCSRLSGSCIELTPDHCGNAARPTGGSQVAGGFCFYKHADDGLTSGCGAVDADDICAHGSLCAATSPEGIAPVCGYPINRSGICRAACDPCGQGLECGDYEGCFVVTTDAGDRGVCMPVGIARGECGEIQCAPGESCRLHGSIGGYAHGTCVRHCDPTTQSADGACPEGQTCQAHARLKGVGTCGSVVTPGG